MSKLTQCYYVISIVSSTVVKDITDAGFMLGFDVHKDGLITIGSFVECSSQREAKRYRKEHGGIILKGLKEV